MRYHYEKVLLLEGQSFATEDVVGPVIDCVFHVHPEYELTYVASSRGTRFVGSDIGIFEEGGLTLFGPMLPHHYFSSISDSLSPTWGHAMVVKFDRVFNGVSLFEVPELSRVVKMLDASSQGLDFDPELCARLAPKIKELFKAEGPRRLILLLEILARLADSDYTPISAGYDASASFDTDPRIDAILSNIHAHIEGNKRLSLLGAAKSASLSPEAFSRLFKRITRKSFIAYVTEMKLERASLRLINSDDTVAEICYSSGFNNLSNFNRLFMKRKGVTPLQYRKAFRKF